MQRLGLNARISQLETKLDNLAYKICEVEGDFDPNYPSNRKYRKLKEELRKLREERAELSRTFNTNFL